MIAIKLTAQDGKKMTVAELKEFVAKLEQNGASDDSRIKADLSWNGYLRAVEVEPPRGQ